MNESQDPSPPLLSVTHEAEPTRDDVRLVQQGLEAYNLWYAPADNYQPLVVFLHTADKSIVGGLLGATYWQWLHVGILWIQATCRGKGYGERLPATGEQAVARRSCRAVHLDTLSFQARAFYEKLGYSVFGQLADHPAGHSRYYLKNDLR